MVGGGKVLNAFVMGGVGPFHQCGTRVRPVQFFSSGGRSGVWPVMRAFEVGLDWQMSRHFVLRPSLKSEEILHVIIMACFPPT